MTYPTRQVTATLDNGSPLPGYRLSIVLLTTPAVANTEVTPPYTYTGITDSNGQVVFTLPVSSSSEIAYKYNLVYEDGTNAKFSVLPGSAISLAELLTQSNFETSPGVAASATVIDALDNATITAVTVAADDEILMKDASDSNKLKTVTAQSIADLASGGGSDHDAVTLGTNTANALSLSGQVLSIADVFLQKAGGNLSGNLGVRVTALHPLHVKGTGNTGATSSVLIQNSDNNSLLRVDDDADITLGSTGITTKVESYSSGRNDFRLYSSGSTSQHFGFYTLGGDAGSTYGEFGFTPQGSAQVASINFDTRAAVAPFRFFVAPAGGSSIAALTIFSDGHVGVGVNNTNDGYKFQIKGSANEVQQVIQGHTTQTTPLTEWQNSAGTAMSSMDENGGFSPASMADSAANNETIYYSTTASKLVYKDSGGAVNALY